MLRGGKLFQKIQPQPSRIRIVQQDLFKLFRHFVQFAPTFFDISIIAKQNLSSGVNIVSVGSPSRIRIVLLISFGITTLPRSSILLTIPVAFIYTNLLEFSFFIISSLRILFVLSVKIIHNLNGNFFINFTRHISYIQNPAIVGGVRCAIDTRYYKYAKSNLLLCLSSLSKLSIS